MSATAVQQSLDDMGEPLHEVTFVVVDLETTGGSAQDAITEIGAVKVRGGQVLGEFQTLVDPGRPIPALVVSLTGLTDAMVTTAPRIESVLPSFLEFAAGAVLVAHNAPFDTRFLRRACESTGHPWPRPTVVDTAKLARALVDRNEARDRLDAFLAGTARSQRLAPLAATAELVAARRDHRGGWEFLLIRYGRFAGSCVAPPRVDPMPYVDALQATGEQVRPAPPPATAATYEESDILLRWLEGPQVRLVRLDGSWHSPVKGAVRFLSLAAREGQDPAVTRPATPG